MFIFCFWSLFCFGVCRWLVGGPSLSFSSLSSCLLVCSVSFLDVYDGGLAGCFYSCKGRVCLLRESMVRQAGITQQQQGGSSLQHSTINLFNDHDRSTWHLFQKQMEDDEDDEDDWLRYVVVLSLFLLRYVTFTFLNFLCHVTFAQSCWITYSCVCAFGLCFFFWLMRWPFVLVPLPPTHPFRVRALCVVELLMFVLLTCCVFFTCVFLFLVVGLDCLVCVCLCVGVPTLPTLVSVSQSVRVLCCCFILPFVWDLDFFYASLWLVWVLFFHLTS